MMNEPTTMTLLLRALPVIVVLAPSVLLLVGGIGLLSGTQYWTLRVGAILLLVCSVLIGFMVTLSRGLPLSGLIPIVTCSTLALIILQGTGSDQAKQWVKHRQRQAP